MCCSEHSRTKVHQEALNSVPGFTLYKVVIEPTYTGYSLYPRYFPQPLCYRDECGIIPDLNRNVLTGTYRIVWRENSGRNPWGSLRKLRCISCVSLDEWKFAKQTIGKNTQRQHTQIREMKKPWKLLVHVHIWRCALRRGGEWRGWKCRQKPYYKDRIFVHQVSKFHSMLYYEFLALSHRTISTGQDWRQDICDVELQRLEHYCHHGTSDISFLKLNKNSISHYIHHSSFSRLEYCLQQRELNAFSIPNRGPNVLTKRDPHGHTSLQRHSQCPLRRPLSSPSSCHTASQDHITSAQGTPIMSFFLLLIRAVASQGSFQELPHVWL